MLISVWDCAQNVKNIFIQLDYFDPDSSEIKFSYTAWWNFFLLGCFRNLTFHKENFSLDFLCLHRDRYDFWAEKIFAQNTSISKFPFIQARHSFSLKTVVLEFFIGNFNEMFKHLISMGPLSLFIEFSSFIFSKFSLASNNLLSTTYFTYFNVLLSSQTP